MKVAVVTPTIGSEHLSQCINSVDKQTHKDITHYVCNMFILDTRESDLIKIEPGTVKQNVALELVSALIVKILGCSGISAVTFNLI